MIKIEHEKRIEHRLIATTTTYILCVILAVQG